MEMLSLKQEDFSWNHSAGICLAAHFLLFVPQTPKSKSKPSQRLKQGNISRGHQAKTKGSFIFFTVRIGWHVTGMACFNGGHKLPAAACRSNRKLWQTPRRRVMR